MSQYLNQDEILRLADLLVRSQKVEARKALCRKIGIEPNQLAFISDQTDESFAINLISYLNEVGNTTAICQLCCQELRPIFQRGQHELILKEIAIKLNCKSQFFSRYSPSEPTDLNENSLPTSGVKSLFDKIVKAKNKLITGGIIILLVLAAGYPTYEYLKQPSQLVEVQMLKQKAALAVSEIEGNIGEYKEGVIPVKPTKVNLINFIVEAQFDNPYDGATNNWTYGFAFQENTSNQLNDPQRKSFDLWVSSMKKEWRFGTTSSGKLPNLNLSDKNSNTLTLIVKDKKATFFVNDRYIETFDVSEFKNKGDVFLLAKDGISGKLVQYRNLRVWSLDN
ncbi:hypothetical protein ACE1CI_03765 [Aerosakkonemataceae cyanobacterium BLCC-F50]|uniref:Uncharacterized protein n=1 Tax=Floridaenema flaviceps BLCC-F50 TaxID=3153642 RepID=A0ABV4XK08_9CYAN